MHRLLECKINRRLHKIKRKAIPIAIDVIMRKFPLDRNYKKLQKWTANVRAFMGNLKLQREGNE